MMRRLTITYITCIACIAAAEIEQRVVGGREATPYRESYVVALASTNFDGEENVLYLNQFCGGSLIGDGSVVLTAAHCVADDYGEPYPAEYFQAAVHWHDLEDPIGEDCSALIDVKKIKVHPGYEDTDLFVSGAEDVALLFLKEAAPCVADGRTKTVELDWSAGDRAGQTTRVLGWGAYAYFGSYATKLQQADVRVISNRDCSAQLRDVGSSRDVEDYEVCATRPGKDACTGDSGGPLVVYDGNRVVQIGVVAWGVGCGTYAPGVYMRVSALADWIASKVDGIEEPDDCADDDSWYYKKQRKGCAWVAAKTKRCKKKGVDGVKAKRACREACGRC